MYARKIYVDFVQDMLSAANKIILKTKNFTFQEFETNDTLYLAIERLFEILGEAANRIPKEIQVKYSQIPWRTIVGMRNIIIHAYDRVDIEEVWNTIKEDVPTLIEPLQKMLTDLEKE